MGYELRTRWLEGFEHMPEIESLKRQIGFVTREIARRRSAEAAVERLTLTDPVLAKAYDAAPFNQQYQSDTQALQEVLATLERLMPPF